MTLLELAIQNARSEFQTTNTGHVSASVEAAAIVAPVEDESTSRRVTPVMAALVCPVLVVCDGWTEPRHPRVVLREGDPGRVSHGICPTCAAKMNAEMDKERR